MTELLLHMNNYSITEAITAYQTYPKSSSEIFQFMLCNVSKGKMFIHLLNLKVVAKASPELLF